MYIPMVKILTRKASEDSKIKAYDILQEAIKESEQQNFRNQENLVTFCEENHQ